ncbi:hypothetical protein H4Q26_000464 [Puccinia striiformis f. sp. tritici PST-130]|nr:hypothetical protein H4Q26_000464 [Puccinia striiformis f. sp. tritici PST-130]
MELKSEKTLRRSASAYLRRKLSSKRVPAPSRATTLPADASRLKTSKDTRVTMLHPTKLCENPRMILHNVAEYFSKDKSIELRVSSDDGSIESTPAAAPELSHRLQTAILLFPQFTLIVSRTKPTASEPGVATSDKASSGKIKIRTRTGI